MDQIHFLRRMTMWRDWKEKRWRWRGKIAEGARILYRLQDAVQGSASLGSRLKNAVATWLLSPVWSAQYNPC